MSVFKKASSLLALKLHTLVTDGLISEYTFFFIPETTNDLQGSKQVRICSFAIMEVFFGLAFFFPSPSSLRPVLLFVFR